MPWRFHPSPGSSGGSLQVQPWKLPSSAAACGSGSAVGGFGGEDFSSLVVEVQSEFNSLVLAVDENGGVSYILYVSTI